MNVFKLQVNQTMKLRAVKNNARNTHFSIQFQRQKTPKNTKKRQIITFLIIIIQRDNIRKTIMYMKTIFGDIFKNIRIFKNVKVFRN